ncbi:hypothetical protein [Amycolatopsis sp.]|uniref:hypothetical protein n=1 Tax=Amycolatopsis sp. TaxID=37632 RepID=UPI002D0C6481|nr:hypothetical protein [Amycolatopsis sp.]HVV07751.1 hypothetical protein [Amycolatopsis sp.]
MTVLKVTPERDIAETEATALRAWSGSPAVADLLDADLDAGALLLDGIVPGTTLAERGTAHRTSFAGTASGVHVRPRRTPTRRPHPG